MPRRIIACLLIFTLITAVLAGCTKKSKLPANYEEPITSQFSCDFVASYKEMLVKGHVERSNVGTLKMTLTEPDTVAGIALEWANEKMKITMNGLSFEVDPTKVPEGALGAAILASLDSSIGIAGESALSVTEEGAVLNGSTPLGDYKMVSDPETGYIKSLEIPSLPLTATFVNFQVETVEVLTPPVIPTS